MKSYKKKIVIWICGQCGADYPTSTEADVCCTCESCGEQSSYRTCVKCDLKTLIQTAKWTINKANQEMKEYKKRLKLEESGESK